MSVPLAYIGVILIWSTTPLAIKWSAEEVGFIFGVSLRMLIGALLCLLLVFILRMPFPWHKQARRSYLAAAFGIYLAMVLVYWGAQYVASGLISVIFGLSPLLTALLAFFFLGERHLTPRKLFGIALGFTGLLIIFHQSLLQGVQGMGVLLVLASVTIHVVSAVWVKRINAQLPALAITAGALLYALPAYLLTWGLIDGHWPAQIPQRALLSIVYLGMFGSVLGFVMYFYILRQVDATRVALLTLITPVLALLIGRYLNNEAISFWIAMGTVLILTGMALFQWGHLLVKKT